MPEQVDPSAGHAWQFDHAEGKRPAWSWSGAAGPRQYNAARPWIVVLAALDSTKHRGEIQERVIQV